jgi:hypothetical protein
MGMHCRWLARPWVVAFQYETPSKFPAREGFQIIPMLPIEVISHNDPNSPPQIRIAK